MHISVASEITVADLYWYTATLLKLMQIEIKRKNLVLLTVITRETENCCKSELMSYNGKEVNENKDLQSLKTFTKNRTGSSVVNDSDNGAELETE